MTAESAAKFRVDISGFAARAKEKADLVARKVVLDVGRSVILMSPVGNPSLWKNKAPPGYVGGHFRRNWQFAIGSIPRDEIGGIDPSGQAAISDIAAKVSVFSMGMVGYIANNAPYANRLEYGWSTQAPAGMVRITVAQFQGIVNKATVEAN